MMSITGWYGVPVVLVDTRKTSSPPCGHTSESNRPERDVFRCDSCSAELPITSPR
ncbi:zinc ribbon domain-containing protein [Methanothrix sp.]|uniref:zinc ribbon domain-containing protein n=1 Tax=Methanothrix sp. TaxID=90426 RepID=UPI0034468128